MGFPHTIFDRASNGEGKLNIFRDAVDGERAMSYETVALLFVVRALESEFREFLHIEEIRTLQMPIALVVASIDAGGYHVHVDVGFSDIAGVVVDGSVEIAECAGNVTDHQMADGETDLGVCLIQVVGIGKQKRAAK